jgi:hypothetical protein
MKTYIGLWRLLKPPKNHPEKRLYISNWVTGLDVHPNSSSSGLGRDYKE